jgi:glycosyltransferase involved in cell wall biosynthesis
MPSTLSPWRSYEYSELCKVFNNTRILTDITTFEHYRQDKSFEDNLAILTENYPALHDKIKKLKFISNLNGKVTYMLFYNNVKKHFEVLNRNKNPFTFTLYPGGGFGFDDKTIDENLKRYFDSKYFKGVIVNQNITKKYLIDKQLCDPNQINLISGVPLNLDIPEIQNFEYQKDTDKTSILFFANKYTPDGSDKGFDVFQKIVLALMNQKDQFNFIVIGGFSESDLIDSKLKNVIIFKGVLNEFEFESVLKETHILLSPNKPFLLSENAFDGFPLATCVTASLYGNVNFMTDYFNESDYLELKEEQDFIKIESDLNYITDKIIELHNDRDLLRKIAENGRNKMLHLYSFEKQITPRIDHFKKILF